MSWNLKFSCILALLVFSVACYAARLPAEGIVEGDEAIPNQFPYQVALRTKKYAFCGGGIIDEQFILTAAHCIIRADGSFRNDSLFIAAGDNDLQKSEGVIVFVEKMYALKDYDPKYHDSPADIAVLKLNKKLDLNNNPKMKKLKLPKNQRETYADKKAMIAGWGWDWIKIVKDPVTHEDKEEGGKSNLKLKYLRTDVLDSRNCQVLYGIQKKIRDSHICALAEQTHKSPSGICSGDSGSPLVYKNETVIGIVSHSPMGCNEWIFPAVYTRVSKYLYFIEQAKNDDVTDYMIASKS